MSVTSPQDVMSRADRALTAAEQGRLPVLIEDVELIIGARYRVAGGLAALDLSTVRMVVSWAVLDLLARTPGGPTSTEVSVDDGRVVDRFEADRGADVWIRDAWWALLDPKGGSVGGAFTIAPTYTSGSCR